MRKRKYITLLVLILIISMLTGCGTASKKSKLHEKDSEKTETLQENNEKTDDGYDHELGLKLAKVQNMDGLTEEQEKVVQYFDEDYIALSATHAYEFLKRYPDVFQKTQIQLEGTITQVLESSTDTYEIIVWLGPCSEKRAYYYENYAQDNPDNLVAVKVKTGNQRWIEGDEIGIRGTYIQEIAYTDTTDNSEVMLPFIQADDIYLYNSLDPAIEMYDAEFIKDVASAIFGEDIMITSPEYSKEEVSVSEELMYENTIETYEYGIGPVYHRYYTCELDNQTNSNFTRFYFPNSKGMIIDEKGYCANGYNSNFEFTPDFKHFMMFTQNKESDGAYLDVTSWNSQIEYYDTDLNKIWKRDFGDAVIKCYDYTSQAIYAVINQDLYILDIETGENLTKPKFIGEKALIRKLEDGLLSIDFMSSPNTIMKTDLEGNILWTTNAPGSIDQVGSIQLVQENFVISTWMAVGDDLCEHYLVVNSETGELVQDVIAFQN